MEVFEWIQGIATVVGLPTIFGFLVFSQGKHVALLREQIALADRNRAAVGELHEERARLLEMEIDRLKEQNEALATRQPDAIHRELVERISILNATLEESRNTREETRNTLTERIRRLEEEKSALEKTIEIDRIIEEERVLGVDYRTEIAREMQRNSESK